MPDSNPDSEEILELESLRGQAMMARDIAKLDEILADDYIHIHATGLMHSKSEALNHVQTATEYVSIVRKNLHLRFYGNVAVMTGDMNNIMRRKGAPEAVKLDARVTQVWVKSRNGWKLTSFQATRIAPPV